MRRPLRSLLLIGLIGYALLCTAVAGCQRQLLYFPEDRIGVTPAALGLDHETVTLHTDDGLELAAWWLPRESPRGAVIICHGNGGNRSFVLSIARDLHQRGFGVLAFDYRGYGGNPGSPSEDGLQLDARAAFEHVTREQGFDAAHVLIYGRSLGAAVAIALATESAAGALVVENSFTSLTDVASEIYPWLPVRLLIRDRWDNAARIAELSLPVFIAHASGDTLIDPAQSTRLAQLAGTEAHAYPGDHNASLLMIAGDDRLDDFLASTFPVKMPAELPE